jgi:RND family efflux transporter MFP subunit
MPLREGELVQADKVVLELGHRIEELRVRRLRMQLESGTKTLEAKSRYEHALKERNRVQKMVEENVGRATDLTDAQLELDIRELALRQAELDESILRNELEQAEASLAQRFVRSPINGIVEKRHFEEGETIERFQAAVEVVSLDPLNVDFDCPIALVDRFELGTQVQVQRDHDSAGSKRIGEVVHCAQQADPASHTLRIRIRLPNPAPHWRAGLKVWLSLENQ